MKRSEMWFHKWWHRYVVEGTDGFSNLAYPTNPVLLICLGLTVVSYPQWLKWTAKLWLGVLAVTIIFLGIGVAIHFGPF